MGRPAARAAIVAAALVAASASPARSEGVGVLVLADERAPVAPSLVRGAARAALGPQAVTEPFARARSRQRAGVATGPRRRTLARARALLGEGWRSYLEARPTFAATRLAEARAAALRVADLADGAALIAESSLRLGAVELELGRPAEAADAFHLAAALAPERQVSDAEFKPEVVAAFAAARTGAAAGALSVSAPGAAVVTIDGVAGAEQEVADGLHLVVARAPGRRPAAELVAVGAGDQVRVTLALERDPRAAALSAEPPLAVGAGAEEAARALDAALVHGELDAILLVAPVWRAGAPAVLAQRCAGAPVRCGALAEVRAPSRAAVPAATASAIERALRAPLGTSPSLPARARIAASDRSVPAARAAEGAAPEAWWQSGWLWAGVGAAALGVAAVAIAGGEPELRPIVSGDPCSFRACP